MNNSLEIWIGIWITIFLLSGTIYGLKKDIDGLWITGIYITGLFIGIFWGIHGSKITHSKTSEVVRVTITKFEDRIMIIPIESQKVYYFDKKIDFDRINNKTIWKYYYEYNMYGNEINKKLKYIIH